MYFSCLVMFFFILKCSILFHNNAIFSKYFRKLCRNFEIRFAISRCKRYTIFLDLNKDLCPALFKGNRSISKINQNFLKTNNIIFNLFIFVFIFCYFVLNFMFYKTKRGFFLQEGFFK